MTTVHTEVIRRIYVPGEEPACIEVAPSPDFPRHIVLFSDGQESVDWFGKFEPLIFTCDFARALGQALIDAANEEEVQK